MRDTFPLTVNEPSTSLTRIGTRHCSKETCNWKGFKYYGNAIFLFTCWVLFSSMYFMFSSAIISGQGHGSDDDEDTVAADEEAEELLELDADELLSMPEVVESEAGELLLGEDELGLELLGLLLLEEAVDEERVVAEQSKMLGTSHSLAC